MEFFGVYLPAQEGRNRSDNEKQNRRCFVNYEYRLISGFSAYFMSYVCRNPDFLFSRFSNRKIVKIKFRENRIVQPENIMRKWTLWASVIIDFITQMSCGGIITDFLKQLKNIFTIFWKNQEISFYIEFCLHSINQHQNYVNQKEESQNGCN